jgi:hypothetical protein
VEFFQRYLTAMMQQKIAKAIVAGVDTILNAKILHSIKPNISRTR